jgi:alpha-L-fucosidase
MEVETGTWAYHQKQYGADYPYQNFAPQFRAELFDPDQWADVLCAFGSEVCGADLEASRGVCAVAQQGSLGNLGQAMECGRDGPKRDLLGDLSDAVRRKGLRMGSITRSTSGTTRCG